MSNNVFTARLRLLALFSLVLTFVLVGKLYFVQVVHGESFSERADRQYVRPQGTLFERGAIFFTDKDGNKISAAAVASGFLLAINPRVLENHTETYARLSEIIPLDHDDFLLKAGKSGDPYEVVARRLTRAQADAVSDLHIDGLTIEKENWRVYPGGTSAAHTLGFIGFQGDELAGRYGLERYYNDVLERTDNDVYVNFFAELLSGVGDVLFDRGVARQGDLVLTIEPTAQGELEGLLAQAVSDWDARGAGGVVLDPMTGKVVALAAFPNFDPNNFSDAASASVFTNPIVEDVYEMGSIIKPLTMAAGLDAGVVTAQTTYNDQGTRVLNGSRISNYDREARGVVPMQEVLNQSLNTGVAFVAVDKLGTKKFGDYMRAFGVGEETGIDLPGEVRGLIGNLESPREIEYATASFGQGVAFTPIATARALSALGNGGKLITPYVVQEVEHDLGYSRKIFYEPDRQVIKPETSEEITRMLVKVVDEALLGGTAKLPRYSVAAKTGTAQIASPNGGYYDDRYFHSFFGYFPAYEPRFLVFLYLQEPRGVRYASQTLASPFMEYTKFLISYYDIPPDR